MNMLTRLLALVTGLSLIAGCASVYDQWFTLGADHRPTVETGYIKGRVVDAYGRGIAGAQVSNGAAVFFTSDGSAKIKADDGTDDLTLTTPGEFVLSKVNTGIQYVTATFDGEKSEPARILVVKKELNVTNLNAGGDNSLGDLIISTQGPLSAGSTAIKLIQVFPDTLTATFSTEIASGSTTPTFGGATYGNQSRDITLSVAAPPNGAGQTIRSYRVEYEGPTPGFSADFSPIEFVGPGSKTSSGPTTNLLVKRVGPTTKEFSADLATASIRIATIKLYTVPAANQANDKLVDMSVPTPTEASATASFEAKVTLELDDR